MGYLCLVLVCGLPASGKTTIIEYISRMTCSSDDSTGSVNPGCNLHALSRSHISVVSIDMLYPVEEQCKMIHIDGSWKKARKNFVSAADQYIAFTCGFQHNTSLNTDSAELLQKIKDFNLSKMSSSNKIFFIEDNFYYRSMRYEWFQISRKYSMGYCQIFLKCPVDISLKRNKERADHIPDEAVILMNSKFEMPNHQNFSWEKNSLILDTNIQEETIELIDQIILNGMNNPVFPIEDISKRKREAQAICTTNVIHQVDHVLRKLTGKFIKNIKEQSDSKKCPVDLIKQINDTRRQILHSLKQGTLILPTYFIEVIENGEIGNVVTGLEDFFLPLIKIE